MEPANSSVTNQSFVEARLAAGGEVTLHYHKTSEELYHVLTGSGVLTIEGTRYGLNPGDTIRIAPFEKHKFANTGTTELVFFCVCAPPFSEHDTILIPDPD